MRVVSFKLDKELLQQLDLYCVNHKLTRSEAIREAIELYLRLKLKKEGRVYRKNSVKENKNNRVRVRRT
jgi:metal-responsive CopG/Arc/MetJ family transcriptional regulator